MLTFYHSPQSRSTRVLALIHAMGKLDEIDVKTVTVSRQDGSAGPDAANPHPEKKVPLLVDVARTPRTHIQRRKSLCWWMATS